MTRKKKFTPLGIDHIVIACHDRTFWKRVLMRIGWNNYLPDNGDAESFERMHGSALVFGAVKIFLVDATCTLYSPKNIYEFLAHYGDMQIFSIAVSIDSAVRAWDELVRSGFSPTMLADTSEYRTGRCNLIKLALPQKSSFSWELVEHASPQSDPDDLGPIAIDHLAIAVSDLDMWVSIYKGLGFSSVYRPRKEIAGTYSGMKTVAMRRGGWTVALVEGVDGERYSQVSTHVALHGDHSAQHVALRFRDLPYFLETCLQNHVQFRVLRKDISGDTVSIGDILHYGRDQDGELFQCFTKPLKRRVGWKGGIQYWGGGLFFEFLERLPRMIVPKKKKVRAFYDQTVRGLYESIEDEQTKEDRELILPKTVLYNIRPLL